MNKKERFIALILILVFTIQLFSLTDFQLVLPDTKSPQREPYSSIVDATEYIMVPKLIDGNPTQETSKSMGSGSSIDVSPPKFDVDESNDTHYWVIDPTGQVDGYWIEIGSGFQELNSSRGQTGHQYYNETEGSYRFQSDTLVNKTNVVEGTDWVTKDEYPSRFIIRLTNGSIRVFETPEGLSDYISLVDNNTIWAVGYESFEGIMGFYLNFQDTNWGHGQYVFWPRLKNGQISGYNQPLYAIYPHLFTKFNDIWYDKILNDRSLYTEPYQNPRNTLNFFNTSDTFGVYFTTNNVFILGSTFDFIHGFKFNFTDQQHHLITRFRCKDRSFQDIGMGYEITSSPQSDGTLYQPDRFRLKNATHQVEVNISQAWQAGTYLDDYYSRIDIISENNESFRFVFDDMETIGFTEKYLELHDQQMPDESTRKALLVGMYGYGALVQDTWLNIDPATGTLSLSDNFDLYSYNTGGGEIYSGGSDYVEVGKYYMSTPVVLQYTYTGFMMWDTQIEVNIISTYTYSVVLNVYVDYDTVEAGEGMKCRVYDIDGTGDGYSSHNAREDSLSYSAGTNYVSTGLVLTDPGTGSKTMDATNMELCTDYWATNRGDNENYIKFRFEQYGCDNGQDDYIYLEDFEDSKSTPATLAFSYYVATPPTAAYYDGMQNTYAGKEFATIRTDHADANGVADVDICHVYLGITDVWYGATWNVDTDTAGETGSYQGWGSISGVSEAGITNGFRLTWTLTLDWDFGYEDVDYDVYARTYDEGALSGSSGWIEAGTTTHESDLEVDSLYIGIDGAYEYGGTNGEIDDADWFKGGYEVTASGSVEYEGSTQTFDSSYAAGVDVELLYGGVDTNQIDTTIVAGVFTGITYTPTSGSNDIDITTGAYFDVKINDVPTPGSDVTAAGIQKTSKRDNQIPTMTSITVTGDGTVTGYEDWDQNGAGFSIDFSTTSDGEGSGFAAWRVDVEDSTPDLYSTTDDPYTYPDDVGTSGSYTFYARPRDNVWNQGTVRSDIGYVDETNPTIWATEFTNEDYDAGTTCWFDQGDIATANFQIPYTETNVYSIVVTATGGLAPTDWVSGGSPFDSTISITGKDDMGAQTISITITDKSGRTDTDYSGDNAIALDDTAPTGVTGLIHSDSNTGDGYDPQNGYDDDLSAHYEIQGTASDGSGSGLPTNCYRYEWNDGGFGSWVAVDTYDATVVDGQSADADAEITDNVGNIVSQDGEDITIDDDAPTGFTVTWTRHTGYPTYNAYLSGSIIYYDSGDNDYFGFQINTGGTIGNSLYWKSEFDIDGVIDPKTTDTSGLPDSDDQYYLSAGSGTFIVRLVNNAGNWQEWTYTATADNTNPTLTDAMSAYGESGDVGEMFGVISANIFYFSNSFDTDGTATFTATGTDGGSDVCGIDFGSWGGDDPSLDTGSPYQGQYTVNNADVTGSITVTIYDHVGNSASGSITCTEDATSPTVTTTAESESSDYLYSGYGTVKQGFYGSQMGSVQSYTISGTGSDGLSGMTSVSDDTSFGDNPGNSGTETAWIFIYTIDAGDNGNTVVTYTGYDHVGNSNTDTYTFYEDNTAPTGYSLALVADAPDGGYTPVFGYYDDDSVNVDATDIGSITEGESGLSPTPYSFKTDLVGWSSYQSGDTYEYTGVSDGSRTCYVKVRDNVYNQGSDQTVGVVVDTDNPTGFTVTWSRHTGWSDDYHAYLSGSTLYYSNLENDYFNLLVNNDGTIQNSGYWKIRWDLNSIFETWEDDTDALPESKDFYYYDDTGVNFVIRIINNAGNYQSFDFTGTLDVTKPNSYALSLGSYYSSPGEDVIVSGSTTDGISGLLSSDCYEWWINPTRDYGTSYTTATQKTWSGVTDLYPVFYAAAWDNVGNWRNASEIMGSFFQIIFITDPQPEIEEIEVTEYYDPDDVFYDDLPLKVASIEPEEDDSKRESLTETDIQIPEEIFYDEIQDTKAESNNETDRIDESNNETDRIDESLNIITIRKTQLRWVLPSILSLMPIIIILRRKRVRRNLIE